MTKSDLESVLALESVHILKCILFNADNLFQHTFRSKSTHKVPESLLRGERFPTENVRVDERDHWQKRRIHEESRSYHYPHLEEIVINNRK